MGNYKERDAHDNGWRNILVSESNYWVKNGDFKKAIDMGAHAVVVGTAINRVEIITNWFVDEMNK